MDLSRCALCGCTLRLSRLVPLGLVAQVVGSPKAGVRLLAATEKLEGFPAGRSFYSPNLSLHPLANQPSLSPTEWLLAGALAWMVAGVRCGRTLHLSLLVSLGLV